jgi:hypothetical protein
MGQRENGGDGLIDADFTGLAAPLRVHELGRPDIAADRPGQTLVSRVQEFAAAGGFKAMAAAAAALREEGDRPDPARGGASGPSLPQAAAGPADVADLDRP